MDIPETCDSCGDDLAEPNWEARCNECESYTVVIAVKGTLDGSMIPGVYGQSVVAKSPDHAMAKGVDEFKANPVYNTDISVDKTLWPDGRYLDDWGYQASTARAVLAKPAEDLPSHSVSWSRFGAEARKALL